MTQEIDPNDYETPKRVKSEKRKRGVVVSVRLSGDELAAIEALANRRGLLISTYLRERGLAPVDAPVLMLPAQYSTLTYQARYQSLQIDCSNR